MSDIGLLNLKLHNLRDEAMEDPETRIEVFRLDGIQSKILEFRKQSFPLAGPLELPRSQRLVCNVMPRRFRFCKTGIFTLMDGNPLDLPIRMMRDPKRWQASFTTWNQLPSGFDDLKHVLGQGPHKLMDGPNLGLYTEDRYNLVGDQVTALAKAALLNIFVKLMETKEPVGDQHPWFSFIRRILVIDRERFYAVVDPEMMEIVKRIRERIQDFDEYEKADHSRHVKKLRKHLSGFNLRQNEMLSVKTDERHANLQLTLAPATDAAGQPVMLLDADLDENGDLFNHLIDVLFVHPVSGGTHPFDICEYLGMRNRASQFGYELKPN